MRHPIWRRVRLFWSRCSQTCKHLAAVTAGVFQTCSLLFYLYLVLWVAVDGIPVLPHHAPSQVGGWDWRRAVAQQCLTSSALGVLPVLCLGSIFAHPFATYCSVMGTVVEQPLGSRRSASLEACHWRRCNEKYQSSARLVLLAYVCWFLI